MVMRRLKFLMHAHHFSGDQIVRRLVIAILQNEDVSHVETMRGFKIFSGSAVKNYSLKVKYLIFYNHFG